MAWSQDCLSTSEVELEYPELWQPEPTWHQVLGVEETEWAEQWVNR